MSRDELCALWLIGSLALWVMLHLLLALALGRVRPGWQALLAFLFVPLAPYWGLRARLRVRVAFWLVSALAYVFGRLVLAR